jgi:tetratricopeptide (TPR) repeat protein
VLNRLYRSKSFYLWSAVLLFLLIQTGHGRNRPSQDLLTSGRQALAAGNYNQAEDYLRRSIDRANAPEADTVLALADLGNLLLIEGRVNEAEAMLDRAIGMVRLNLTLDQRQLPILLGALGNLYRKTRRFKESEATLKEALQIGPRLLGETSVQVADLYNNFGVLHLAVGNTGKAKKDLKKALFINEKTFDRALKTQVRPVMVPLQRLPFRDFAAEEFLGGQVVKCRPGAGCMSIFKDSALTLGQMGDALVYFGKP